MYPCPSVLVRGTLYLLALRAEILIIFDPPDLPTREEDLVLRNQLPYASSKHACNNKLTLFVEVAAVSPIPKN